MASLPETAFAQDRALPAIPVVDAPADDPLALLRAEEARTVALLASARELYPAVFLRLGDRISRRWLARTGNPYLAEIDAVAAALGAPGAHILNLSHEWGCTTGVMPAEDGAGGRLLRALDWPQPGLGRNLVAARLAGPAGPWLNLTWPGFVGCIQALAPGRFAAALNQAPLRRVSGLFALDWLVARRRFWRAEALPPAHLLRRIFETCRSYAEAKAALSTIPLALPAIFTLAGAGAAEGCVIERLETTARVHEAPAAVANHWLGAAEGDFPRGAESLARQRLMAACLAPGSGVAAWLRPPIVNPLTRLVMAAEPTRGRLFVQGYETEGPATRPLRLEAGARPRSSASELPGKALTGGAAAL